MRDFENLLRTLSKFIDLALDSHLFDGVFDAFNIDHAFISEGMEQVKGLDGFLTSLLVAKDQVNPFMQMVRDILRL